jgi:hypothetical protein
VVRFEVKNKSGDKLTLEKKVQRWVQIKRHGAELQKRPVILLGICLGYFYKEIEVNLVDRSDFNYPMLIGRSFMADSFIVDPSACHEPDDESERQCFETKQATVHISIQSL